MIIPIEILKAFTKTFRSGKFEETKQKIESEGYNMSFNIPKENWSEEPTDELFSQDEFGIISIVGNEIESVDNSTAIQRKMIISTMGFIQGRGKIRENIALLIETILGTIKQSE